MNNQIKISKISIAEKTKELADAQVELSLTTDDGFSILDEESCSGDGHIRKITYSGGCYVQICCGGQWLFVSKNLPSGQKQWCTCNLGQAWNVACSGSTYIIGCM